MRVKDKIQKESIQDRELRNRITKFIKRYAPKENFNKPDTYINAYSEKLKKSNISIDYLRASLLKIGGFIRSEFLRAGGNLE